MVSGKGPEWLPPGFTEKLKVRNGRKIRYYCNMATGKEFYLKKDVINCAKTEEICNGSPRRTVNKDSVSPDDNIGSTSTKENDSTEWLPNGWIMEERPKKGTSKKSYKVYINTADGKKYFTKKSVVEYLKTVQRTSDTVKHIKDDTVVQSSSTPDASRQRKSITRSGCSPQENKNGNNDHSLNTVAIESPSSDWLPPGWKEEIKMLKNKMRKYYVDPASGYVFYSKADVDRYLKSNDISSCVVRPKKRAVDDQALMEKETPRDNVRQTRLRKDMSEHRVTELSTPNENKEGNDKQEMVASEEVLPPGWTKEIKIKKSGSRIRKDPLYTDPVSGYQFHSKKDAFRYLKTNDIRSCCTRPTKKKLDDQEFINNETTHDNKQESSLNQDASQEHLMGSSGCTPEWNKNHEGEHSLKKVSIMGASVDGLPPGWRKDIKTSQSGTKIRKDPLYTDPVSGYQFHSKKDALRYLETNDIRSCRARPMKKKLDDQELIKNQITHDNKEESSLNQDASPVMNKNHDAEQLLEKVSILGSSEDDLPAGWRKDIKTSFSGTKIRKDPYYTHPDVGYVFRSKNDVFRYLRSGDIKSCRTRPKKREFIDLNLMNETLQEDVNEDVNESSLKHGASDLHKPTTSSGCTNKEGDEKDVSKMVGSQSPLADGLPEGWITEIKKNKNGTNRKIYTNPSTGSKFYSKAEIARYLRRIENSSTTAEQNKSSSPVDDKLSENSETKKQLSVGWKSNDGIDMTFETEVSVMSEDIDINTLPTSVSTEQKLPESGTPQTQSGQRKSNKRGSQDLTEQKLPESGTGKTQSGSRKSKKRGSPDLPRRTSKRLSASKVDLPPNTLLSESAEDKKSTDAEAININSSSSHPTIVADGVPQPSPIEQVKEVANHTPLGNEILQETEPSNEHEKLVTNDNAVTEEQRQPRGNAIENQENEHLRPQDSQFFYPFGESWSDPCLEFAYKTLTGELPVDDNLEFPGGFPQQVEIPYSQTNSLPPDVPTIFQNEVPTLPPSSVQQIAPPYNQTSGCPQQSDAPSIFRNDVRPPPPPLQQPNPSLSSPMVFPQQNSSLSSPMPFPQHNPLLSSPVSFSFPPSSGVSGQQPRTGAGN